MGANQISAKITDAAAKLVRTMSGTLEIRNCFLLPWDITIWEIFGWRVFM
jgi:hypothetical protein